MNFKVLSKILFILVLNNKLYFLFENLKLIKVEFISNKREEKPKKLCMENVEELGTKMANKYVYANKVIIIV